jgi:hypothetical protein
MIIERRIKQIKNMDATDMSLLTLVAPLTFYGDISRNSRTEAIAKYTAPNKRVWKLPTSTQLRATWHTESLDMVVIQSAGASRYHDCCIDGGTSPEYFGFSRILYERHREVEHMKYLLSKSENRKRQ